MNNVGRFGVMSVLLMGFCSALVAADGSERTMPLFFDHAQHFKMGISCGVCHGAEPQTDGILARPRHDQCTICHVIGAENAETAYPPAGCPSCHTQKQKGVVPPARDFVVDVRFDHQPHLQGGIECTRCHDPKDEKGAPLRAVPMQQCIDCHQRQRVSDDCATCHPTQLGVLTTERGDLRPTGVRVPNDHDPGWTTNHAMTARIRPDNCKSCHSQDMCLSCHDGLHKPDPIHEGDWIMVHPRAARVARSDCQSCHRSETYCRDCHQLVGVEASDPLQPNGRGVHPPAWNQGPRSEEHHAVAAQRNITTCMACHDQNSCATCHATSDMGGLSVSPHGFGWKGADLYNRNQSMCTVCHATSDPNLEIP